MKFPLFLSLLALLVSPTLSEMPLSHADKELLSTVRAYELVRPALGSDHTFRFRYESTSCGVAALCSSTSGGLRPLNSAASTATRSHAPPHPPRHSLTRLCLSCQIKTTVFCWRRRAV